MNPQIEALTNQVKELKSNRAGVTDSMAVLSELHQSLSDQITRVEYAIAQTTIEATQRQLAATACLNGECE